MTRIGVSEARDNLSEVVDRTRYSRERVVLTKRGREVGTIISIDDLKLLESWTDGEVSRLKNLANGNTPTRVIGLKLGRTEAAIYNKAHQEGISLSPTNQSPYNRTKK